MSRMGIFFGLAGAFGLLGCSDAFTLPTGENPAPPEVKPPEVKPPAVPVTAALAFVSTRDGAEHIYVANADGSEVTRVTEGSQPAWSWDGRRIAFVREASSAGPDGIYVMNLDGSGLRWIGPGDTPAWSPDDRIAFTGVSGSRPSNGWPLPVYSLYVMNADGSGRTLLDDRTPFLRGAAWSPDGRSIAFRHGGSVWILDVDGSNPRELEEPGERLSAPAWSPDGSSILTTTDPGPWTICEWGGWCRSGPGQGKSSVIYRYDLAAADREVIDARFPGHFVLANPDWSPDGRQQVFDLFDPSIRCGSVCPGGQRRIFVLSVETGELQRLIPEAPNPPVADYDDYAPVWSRVER